MRIPSLAKKGPLVAGPANKCYTNLSKSEYLYAVEFNRLIYDINACVQS